MSRGSSDVALSTTGMTVHLSNSAHKDVANVSVCSSTAGDWSDRGTSQKRRDQCVVFERHYVVVKRGLPQLARGSNADLAVLPQCRFPTGRMTAKWPLIMTPPVLSSPMLMSRSMRALPAARTLPLLCSTSTTTRSTHLSCRTQTFPAWNSPCGCFPSRPTSSPARAAFWFNTATGWRCTGRSADLRRPHLSPAHAGPCSPMGSVVSGRAFTSLDLAASPGLATAGASVERRAPAIRVIGNNGTSGSTGATGPRETAADGAGVRHGGSSDRRRPRVDQIHAASRSAGAWGRRSRNPRIVGPGSAPRNVFRHGCRPTCVWDSGPRHLRPGRARAAGQAAGRDSRW